MYFVSDCGAHMHSKWCLTGKTAAMDTVGLPEGKVPKICVYTHTQRGDITVYEPACEHLTSFGGKLLFQVDSLVSEEFPVQLLTNNSLGSSTAFR